MRPIPDSELAANSGQIAAEVLRHPASLQMPPIAVERLASIASRHPPITNDVERRLLRAAMAMVAAVEMAAGREEAA